MLQLIETKIDVIPSPNNEIEDVNKQEINSEAVRNGLENATTTVIQNIWNLISEINGLISMFDFDYAESNKDSIKEILNASIDDLTVDIGMLYKVISMINEKTTDLIDAGKEKAEELAEIDTDAIEVEDNIDTDSESSDNSDDAVSDEIDV